MFLVACVVGLLPCWVLILLLILLICYTTKKTRQQSVETWERTQRSEYTSQSVGDLAVCSSHFPVISWTSAVEEFHVQDDGRARSRDNLKSTWAKQFEIIKEPYVHALRNLLFNFPGCVYADEVGNRLFLSDSSHHRIIVFDGNGKILDCIGSSPGFEDGNFEFAKMVCPASSIYDATEDCLYFVDSENHAIRKADLGKRVLETLYPNYDANKKSNSIWIRIMIKLGLRSNDKRSEEFDVQSPMFPWYLMKSSEDSFSIINRSCLVKKGACCLVNIEGSRTSLGEET